MLKEIKIRRVQQEDEEGCGIACVAMLTGSTYKQMKRYFAENIFINQKKVHTRNYQIRNALSRHGIHTSNKVFREWRKINSSAIVPISRRRDGGWHWVLFIYDPEKSYVIDPHYGRTNNKYYFRGLRAKGFYISLDH